MKHIYIGLAALAVVAFAVPASAQVTVRGGDEGVSVRVGERDHGRYHGRDRWRHREWRSHHADCRVVKIRKRLPNGNVIVKTRRTCD